MKGEIKMKNKQKTIPYIITIYGTLNTDSDEFEKMKEELYDTNIQYLINKADSKFIEVDEEEMKNLNKKGV